MKSARERQIPYVITYMWTLKYGGSELICETTRLLDIEQTCLAKGEGVGEGWSGRLGLLEVSYYTYNKVLPYSTDLYSISYAKP